MAIDSARWNRLSRYFDEAVTLPAAARQRWLGAIDPADADLAPVLNDLLNRHALLETSDFLLRLPPIPAGAESETNPAYTAQARIGPYVLETEIGHGGMGVVWRATRADGGVQRPVALKLPRAPLLDSHLRARFERERDILAALTHPNIARLYDAGVDDSGQPYLALEYVDGTPLTQYADRERLSVTARLDLFAQVLRAVHFAHTHLVIHRDLKPRNILVTAAGEIRLLDFGIAKLATPEGAEETELTRIGGRALTPDYAAPEQIEGRTVSTASDVYSLGVVLYELLTGERPYRPKRDSRGALEDAIVSDEPRLPSTAITSDVQANARDTNPARLRRSLVGDLDTIVLKALKKRPEERYSTADAFGEDLRRYRAGEPVLARRDSRWYRTRKFVARNRVTVAAGAFVAAALGAGLAVALWQATIARREARTATAIEGFMTDLFRINSINQPDPVRAQKTTARELLDLGTAKVDSALADAPRAQTRVLADLISVYKSLDLESKGLPLAHRRAELIRELDGPTSLPYIDALVDVGDNADAGGAPDEAKVALEQALHLLDVKRDDRSLTRAKAEIYYARHLDVYVPEESPSATRHAERGIALLAPRGPSKDLATAYWVAGDAATNRSDWRAAALAGERGIAVVSALGPDANAVASQLYNLQGYAQTELGDLRNADRTLARALEISRSIAGEESFDVSEATRMRADFMLQTSRAADSAGLLAALKPGIDRMAARGEPSVMLPMPLFDWSGALVRLGRLEEADAALKVVASLAAKNAYPKWFRRRADVMGAQLATARGEFARADQLIGGYAADGAAVTDATESIKRDALFALVRLDLAEGKPEEARRALAKLEPAGISGADPVLTSVPLRVLAAQIRLAESRFDEASKESSTLLAELTARSDADFLREWRAVTLLVRGTARRELGELEASRADLAEAVEIATTIYDPELSPDLALARIALAETDIRRHAVAAARSGLLLAGAAMARHAMLGEQYCRPLAAALHRLQER